MLINISSIITDNLINFNHIKPDEREIYIFGFETILIHGLNFASTLILAILWQQFWEHLLFMILFIPLRSYAGGYHASSPMRCYVLSTGVVALVLLVVRHVGEQNFLMGIIILAIASVLILILAPIGAANRPLDMKEKKVFGHRARVVLITELLIAALCWCCSWWASYWITIMVIVVAAASLVVARILKYGSEEAIL